MNGITATAIQCIVPNIRHSSCLHLYLHGRHRFTRLPVLLVPSRELNNIHCLVIHNTHPVVVRPLQTPCLLLESQDVSHLTGCSFYLFLDTRTPFT